MFFYGSYFELFNELGSLAESNIVEIKAKKKRLNELMNLYGENRIDIENKATNASIWSIFWQSHMLKMN